MKERENMKSVLRGLLDGKVIPSAWPMPHSAEHEKLYQKANRELSYFSERLSESDFSRLEALIDLHTELSSHENNFTSTCCFSLGMLLMLDVTETAALLEK